MLEQLKSYIQKQQLFSQNDRVLIAVSGGKDSMTLLFAMHLLGYKIGAAHINYQLRGADSETDMELVKSTCEKLQIPFHLKIGTIDKSTVNNIQETARTIRYRFFDECLEQFDYQKIATAHHANDDLETLFIQLIRGTGIYGLKGISAKRDCIVRPLLWASQAEIEQFISDHQIPFRDDVSNQSDAYLRNRIRHHLIPLIENEIDETAINKLHTSIELLSQDADAVKTMAEQLLQKTNSGWEINLETIPENTQAIWCYHALKNFRFNRIQLQDLLKSAESGSQILSATHICVKHKNQLQVQLISSQEKLPFSTERTGTFETDFGKFEVKLLEENLAEIPKKNNPIAVPHMALKFPITLRTLEVGDRFQPIGSKYYVKIADYLKDKGLSILEKSKTIVLENGDSEILWIVGIQLSEKARVKNLSEKTILLSLN